MNLIEFPKALVKESDKDFVADLKQLDKLLREDKIKSVQQMTLFLGTSLVVLTASFFLFVSLSGYLANLFKG